MNSPLPCRVSVVVVCPECGKEIISVNACLTRDGKRFAVARCTAGHAVDPRRCKRALVAFPKKGRQTP